MATSIRDLLSVLDDASQAPIDPGDAAEALHHASRTLSAVRADGLGRDYPPDCLDAIRRLNDACAEAAASFAREPGRITDLTAVLADAVATLHDELADADRWALATELAPVARRCAQAIRQSGPYGAVPELLTVLDRADEFQRTAAITPPNPDRLRGVDAPIPITWRSNGMSADAAVLDATAALVAEFRRRDRSPATMRELVAVSHVASRAAAYLLRADGTSAASVADAWTRARGTLVQYTDGIALPAPGEPRSALLQKAMRVEVEVRRATGPAQQLESRPGHRASVEVEARRQLSRLANACHAELGRIAPTLVVLPGAAPLTNERVGEWLRHKPFRAAPPDLLPALRILESAARADSVPPVGVATLA